MQHIPFATTRRHDSIINEPLRVAACTYSTTGRDGLEYKAVDYLWRLPGDRFELEETGGAPEEESRRVGLGLEDVHEWIQSWSDMIEWALIAHKTERTAL